ncbi:putative cytokinetic ring protein SteA [Alteribacillus sp. JSM 102045]|uniref:putative cytokinetic ring protein SteA n=1 Tax=Alteribacillus sp. JSM 102045 TaxID=1562101 RepID=UPI0035C1887A
MTKIQGKACFHEKTKTLADQIDENQIAVIAHEDIDPIAAESLIRKKVKAVINLKRSMSGDFFHEGVKRLLKHKIKIFDINSESEIGKWIHGREIEINNNYLFVIYSQKKYEVGTLKEYSMSFIRLLEERAKKNLPFTFEKFSSNSISYAEKDLIQLLDCWKKWEAGSALQDKDVLIVIRGTDYEKDLDCIKKHFINKKNPLSFVAVDGAANAMLRKGMEPDYIIGDMDSVSSSVLQCGAQLIVHQGAKGQSPGMKRVKQNKLSANTVKFIGLSEDAAIAFALKEGAKKIYLVGGHRDMEEYLSKGRKGMGSSLLIKMLAGSKIIDLKGIHHLYNKKSKIPSVFWRFRKAYHSLPFLRSSKPKKEMRELKA